MEQNPLRSITIWVVFFFTVMFSLLCHIFIYYFGEKNRSLPALGKHDELKFTNEQIAHQTMIIKGINMKKSPNEVMERFQKLIEGDNSIFTGDITKTIIHIHVSGNYYLMMNILNKLKSINMKKDYFQRLFIKDLANEPN